MNTNTHSQVTYPTFETSNRRHRQPHVNVMESFGEALMPTDNGEAPANVNFVHYDSGSRLAPHVDLYLINRKRSR